MNQPPNNDEQRDAQQASKPGSRLRKLVAYVLIAIPMPWLFAYCVFPNDVVGWGVTPTLETVVGVIHHEGYGIYIGSNPAPDDARSRSTPRRASGRFLSAILERSPRISLGLFSIYSPSLVAEPKRLFWIHPITLLISLGIGVAMLMRPRGMTWPRRS